MQKIGVFLLVLTAVATARAGICDRTPAVRDAIVLQLGLSCEEITGGDLADVTELGFGYNYGIGAPTEYRHVLRRDFVGLVSLKEILFQDAKVETMEADAFADLTELEKLQIQDETIALTPGLFDSLVNLKRLTLMDLHLPTLRSDLLSQLKNLEGLDIINCGLETIEPQAFAGLKKLGFISAYSNNLTGLPNDIFAGLESLDFIDLAYSKIETLDPRLFKGIPKLKEMRLSGNPLSKEALTALKTELPYVRIF